VLWRREDEDGSDLPPGRRRIPLCSFLFRGVAGRGGAAHNDIPRCARSSPARANEQSEHLCPSPPPELLLWGVLHDPPLCLARGGVQHFNRLAEEDKLWRQLYFTAFRMPLPSALATRKAPLPSSSSSFPPPNGDVSFVGQPLPLICRCSVGCLPPFAHSRVGGRSSRACAGPTTAKSHASPPTTTPSLQHRAYRCKSLHLCPALLFPSRPDMVRLRGWFHPEMTRWRGTTLRCSLRSGASAVWSAIPPSPLAERTSV